MNRPGKVKDLKKTCQKSVKPGPLSPEEIFPGSGHEESRSGLVMANNFLRMA